jgi:PPOX class probable F420-dependent enzyme
MTAPPQSPFRPDLHQALERARQLHVTTERKDGTRSTVSPIWFMYDGDAVYFTTAPGSFKAKRAARGGTLHVRIGRKDGPYWKGTMALVPDPALAERMRPVYRRRYWLAWLGLICPSGARVAAGKALIVRVRPAPEA